MSIDKEALFKARLQEADVEVEGVGTVRVRGLSRGEVIAMRKATDTETNVDGPRALVIERKMVALGMLDPVLTEAEVKRWQEASPAGELGAVTDKIAELSGMLDDSEKQAMRTFRDEPGPGVRALPGAETEHDGGSTPVTDG